MNSEYLAPPNELVSDWLSWACFWLGDLLGWFLKAETMNNGVQEAIFIHFI